MLPRIVTSMTPAPSRRATPAWSLAGAAAGASACVKASAASGSPSGNSSGAGPRGRGRIGGAFRTDSGTRGTAFGVTSGAWSSATLSMNNGRSAGVIPRRAP
jgi:hypothetical protein